MTETLKKFHWFWAWGDEKEEAWLHEMARQGWHFKSVIPPGFYTFEKGEPRNDFYRLDFFVDSKARADYLQLFKDAGWDYLGEMGSWQYFRKNAAPGVIPKIFTDHESKAQKYQRILAILVVLSVVLTPALFGHDLPERYGWFGSIAWILRLVVFVLMLVGMVSLLKRLGQLKKKL
jgi:hypothetical protein